LGFVVRIDELHILLNCPAANKKKPLKAPIHSVKRAKAFYSVAVCSIRGFMVFVCHGRPADAKRLKSESRPRTVFAWGAWGSIHQQAVFVTRIHCLPTLWD